MFSQNSYEVWVNYHSDDEAAIVLKQDIESHGETCKLLKFDVGNLAEVKNVLGKEL